MTQLNQAKKVKPSKPKKYELFQLNITKDLDFGLAKTCRFFTFGLNKKNEKKTFIVQGGEKIKYIFF